MPDSSASFRPPPVERRIERRVGSSTDPSLTWLGQHHLRLGGCEFYCAYPLKDLPEGHLPVMKTRSEVEGYAQLASEGDQARIVELGIHSGGSTALLRELFRPERLVAVERDDAPVAALERYIADWRLEDVVRPQYGVDQSDRARLTEILDEEFGDDPLDLVVDDASHQYDETLASFEVLFPRLRPGGRFVIEDWRWQHELAAAMSAAREAGGEAAERLASSLKAAMAARPDVVDLRPTPFSHLVLELVLARACGDEVANLTIGSTWLVIERGSAAIDPATFRLSNLYDDDSRRLLARA
ncbi:MAG: class I SAM-dependent methyltransferase [Microthrixaceae bacterium]